MSDKLTLRDRFAIAALQGLIQKTPHFVASISDEKAMAKIDQTTVDIVSSAYRYADAMIAERAK